MMLRRLCLCLLVWLAGCANVIKIEGEQVLNQRLAVTVSDAWNKVSLGAQNQPYEAWTQDGLTLDHLRFWAGIEPGKSLMAAPPFSGGSGQKPPRLPTFRAGMPPDELVGLFELLYAADGSIVTLGRTEPARFAGEPGVRFEFAVLRKSDGVQLQGVGWLAVRNNQLFASTFVAPRLAFFPRLLPRAEAVVATAKIR
ncbi:MAG: hypothetical protein U1F00_20010 [Rhodoferax sp.]